MLFRLFFFCFFAIGLPSQAYSQTFPDVGTIEADSSPALIEAYTTRVNEWQNTQLEIQDLVRQEVSNPDAGYEIQGKPVTKEMYDKFQSLIEAQQIRVAEARQIVHQANEGFEPLPKGTEVEVIDRYNALVEKYNEYFTESLGQSGSASKARADSVLEDINRYQDLYGDRSSSITDINNKREELNRSAKLKTQNVIGRRSSDEPRVGYELIKRVFNELAKSVKKDLYPEVSRIMRGPFYLAFLCWLTWYGFSLMRGAEFEMTVFMFRLGYIVFLYSLMFSGIADVFFKFVVLPVINTSLGLSGFILDTVTSRVDLGDYEGLTTYFKGVAIVGDMASSSVDMAGFVWENYGEGLSLGGYLKGGFLALLIMFTFFLIYVYYFGLIAYFLFAIFLYFSMAPLFLPLIAFDRVKSFGLQWCKSVLGFFLIPIFSAFTIGITISVMLNVWVEFEDKIKLIQSGSGDAFPIEQLGALLVIAILSYILHSRIPEWAAHISGGTTAGLGDALGTVAKTVAGGIAVSKLTSLKSAKLGAVGLTAKKAVGDDWKSSNNWRDLLNKE